MGRDVARVLDSFPGLVGAGLAGCLVAGLAHRAYATFRSSRPHRGYEERRVRCASGNILSYHVRAGRPGGATVVLDAGLMNTSTAWRLVADHLDPAVGVVLYDRAGYRASLRRATEDYSLQESVNDLADVVRAAVPEDSACVLAGHSLGGYLAHRAAAALGDRVGGVVLVDPMHPLELTTSRAQREGSRGTNFTLKLGPGSVAFGSGLLLDKNGLFAFAEGNPHLQELRLELSALSTWRTARREWEYSYAFMLDGGRPLDRLDAPVWVVAAEVTLERIPEHGELYEDYLSSGPGGHLVTVEGASHLSLTGGVDHAPFVADVLQRVAAEVTSHPGGGAAHPSEQVEVDA